MLVYVKFVIIRVRQRNCWYTQGRKTMRRNVTTTTNRKIQSKRMSDEVYKMRREIIDIIYRVKKLVPNMPRISVRVADNDDEVLGCATMGGREMWITERSTSDLAVVLHEILHAWKSIEHDDNCKLMHPNKQLRVSDKELMDIFLTYTN